jgi:hypothetical protein
VPSAILGSLGIGLVWGWGMGTLGPFHRPFVGFLALGAATLLLAAEVFLLASWAACGWFAGAVAVGWWLRLAWRRELDRRRGRSG